MSIRTKLLSTMLAIGLLAVVLVGGFAYRRGYDATERITFDRLTALRESRAARVEGYFEQIRRQVISVSRLPLVADAMRAFVAAVGEIEGREIQDRQREAVEAYYRDEFLPRLQSNEQVASIERYLPRMPAEIYLQYHYIAANPFPVGRKLELFEIDDGSAYSALHPRFQKLFRHLVDAMGFYDVFLIEAESGRIVYSVSKETDFATSLVEGPYRESALAEVYRLALVAPVDDPVRLVDFAPYDPSYRAPALFLAAPIISGAEERVGVVALQISVDELDRVMTGDRKWSASGYGETGETYLVGPDRRMRSNSRFLFEDREAYLAALLERGASARDVEHIRRFGTSILRQEVRTEAVEDALAGGSDTRIIEDYRGVPVLSSYRPLEIEGVDWVLLAEMDVAEAFAGLDQFRSGVRVLGAILTVIVVAAAWLGSGLFLRRLQKLSDGARRLGAGELDARVEVRGRDELAELSHVFNDMAKNLAEQRETIAAKNRENEELLLNILPGPIARRLKEGEEPIADSFPAVTVLFADLVGFTTLASQTTPERVVELLNDLFSRFDDLAAKQGIEKIKTIGDAYMAVAGMHDPRPDHAEAMADMALGMLDALEHFNAENGTDYGIRIGINSGPVVAGVIGRSKFIYDLWGDTVNLASRMESQGIPGEIQVTEDALRSLAHAFDFEPRGEIEVKGRGRVVVHLLRGRRSSSDA